MGTPVTRVPRGVDEQPPASCETTFGVRATMPDDGWSPHSGTRSLAPSSGSTGPWHRVWSGGSRLLACCVGGGPWPGAGRAAERDFDPSGLDVPAAADAR